MASLDSSAAPEAAAQDDRDVVVPGILDEARLLLGQLIALAQDHVSLAAMETRRAGEAFIKAVAMTLLAGFLAFITWLALLAAALIFLVQNDWISPLGGMLWIAAFHGLAAFWLVRKIRAKTRLLMFPATLSSFAANDGANR